MKKQTRRVAQTTVAFDPATGTTSIAIKDKELFPDGFFLKLNRDTEPSTKIRDIFVASRRPHPEWIAGSNEMYSSFKRKWEIDAELVFKDESIRSERTGNFRHSEIFMGQAITGESLTHEAFDRERFDKDGGYYQMIYEKDRTITPRSILIHGDEATGKTSLLEFTYDQVLKSEHFKDVMFFGDRDGQFATYSDDRRNVPRPQGPHVAMDPVDALEHLYNTKKHTVVFIRAHHSLGPRSRVLSGALESLIRSKENPYLSFVVTKGAVDEGEKRFYDKTIEARPADTELGVYALTSPRARFEDLVFHTPSWDAMFGGPEAAGVQAPSSDKTSG